MLQIACSAELLKRRHRVCSCAELKSGAPEAAMAAAAAAQPPEPPYEGKVCLAACIHVELRCGKDGAGLLLHGQACKVGSVESSPVQVESIESDLCFNKDKQQQAVCCSTPVGCPHVDRRSNPLTPTLTSPRTASLRRGSRRPRAASSGERGTLLCRLKSCD